MNLFGNSLVADDFSVDVNTNTIVLEIIKDFHEDGLYDKIANKLLSRLALNIDEYESTLDFNIYSKGKVNVDFSANAQNYLLLNYDSLAGIRGLFNTNCSVMVSYSW
ncbi:hypothetical protein [Helicobacter cetorum]|uniref:hypothetical protein n=1 Tax=Helicobacter cetorum TaxID=138563 RepID=UPI000CF14168|nr:hypothetical protein [Helicobacter cetorum]